MHRSACMLHSYIIKHKGTFGHGLHKRYTHRIAWHIGKFIFHTYFHPGLISYKGGDICKRTP